MSCESLSRDRAQGEALLAALRPSEVGDQDQLRASPAQLFDGWQRRPDPRVVRDLARAVRFVSQRHVEIHAQQHPLARDVEILERAQAGQSASQKGSGIISIAPHGHSSTQMPQPLQ